MKRPFICFAIIFISVLIRAQPVDNTINVDVCVYGGTSAGVIAAYTAALQNKRVLLIEPGHRLGGLSSGGLGFTDIGNKYVVTGLARDFYRRIGLHYGKFEQWIFEPKVAEQVFLDYIKRSGCQVLYGRRINKVNKSGTIIRSIVLENADETKGIAEVSSKQYIDCSYEGDLMAKAKVSYTTGRESNSQYNETVNGVQLKDKHQFPDGVDPYIIPGRPQSGLLWGISDDPLKEAGSGDKKMQAYNFRICLSKDPQNQLPIERPHNYDSTKYELLLRYLSVKPARQLGEILKMDLMPNNKTDINNQGPFSTDMIGMNYKYPDGDYATRESIFQDHVAYTKGFLYFIGHDSRMPLHLRNQMLQWGYPKDEYITTQHWTPQLYVREARRMLGDYIMTQANCQAKDIVEDGIGMAAYNMDSHNAQRIVWNGMVKNEGDVQIKGIQPYPIAYRAITPKRSECTNLLVPVCLSASHMAYGSIRMEPVFMVLAQSAATAATMAINEKCAVQEVNVKSLQQQLKDDPLGDGSTAEILVDDSDVKTISGKWKRENSGGYGPSFLSNNTKPTASIRFEPYIEKSGDYKVYIYYPRLKNAADVVEVKVYNGNKLTLKAIRNADVKIAGQTSGEWVELGAYTLSEGRRVYVETSNQKANGVVAADAVLFVPSFK
ncbi:FAD-dependent oxidoreductase [Niabella ginsengisoli]|uniref:FAD-dependent oxidoreductase n=1 Tax=Niabella ginsengisoli TaxID=522298 RepID=A0ABS9SDI8_9BACT|nr:FAD-dependent oxidoreductase [Niabella ginsengisoli]MCH5596427.1 FAD-dependent oxidoreductase [Niabella ginsengisoli]